MKFGKRSQATPAPVAPDAQASAAGMTAPEQPVTQPLVHEEPVAVEQPVSYEPAADEDTVVEGEAVELPVQQVPAQSYEPPTPPGMGQPHGAPGAMPFPVAEEPVAVVTPGEPTRVSSLGDAGEAYASGHAAAPGPSWQEPVMELANERPELVVAAAFAGGVLAAMILRRLGN